MFRVIGWVCILIVLCSCSHSKEFLIKDQQAEAVFKQVTQYFAKEHPKQIGHYEFLDFEFMAAKSEDLRLELYYRDNEKGALSKLSADYRNWTEARKRISRKISINFVQRDTDVVLIATIFQLSDSEEIHNSFYDYVKILYLDLKKHTGPL